MGNEFIDFDYSKSVIRTNLKLDFDSNNKEFTKVYQQMYIDLKAYCNNKKILDYKDNFSHMSVYDVILKVFRDEVLKKEELVDRGKNYHIIFKAFEIISIKRYKYEKTDTKINANRRKYLFYERVNVYY